MEYGWAQCKIELSNYKSNNISNYIAFGSNGVTECCWIRSPTLATEVSVRESCTGGAQNSARAARTRGKLRYEVQYSTVRPNQTAAPPTMQKMIWDLGGMKTSFPQL